MNNEQRHLELLDCHSLSDEFKAVFSRVPEPAAGGVDVSFSAPEPEPRGPTFQFMLPLALLLGGLIVAASALVNLGYSGPIPQQDAPTATLQLR